MLPSIERIAMRIFRPGPTRAGRDRPRPPRAATRSIEALGHRLSPAALLPGHGLVAEFARMSVERVEATTDEEPLPHDADYAPMPGPLDPDPNELSYPV